MKNTLNSAAARARFAKFIAPLAGLLLLGTAATAPAQIIYRTGFEKPVFVAGSTLAGQDGWIAPPPLSPNAALIAPPERNSRSSQYLRVDGADLEHQDFINEATEGYYDAIGSYRHAVEHDTGGTETIRVSVDVRLDGKKTPAGNLFSAGISAIGVDDEDAASGVGELALSSDGHVYGYSSQDLVPEILTSVHVGLGTWHHLSIEVDFEDRTYSFYVDYRKIGTFDFDPSATSDVFRRGSILTYAAPDTAKFKKADHAANFDNFSIEVVPASRCRRR